jgi:hypothetical protein
MGRKREPDYECEPCGKNLYQGDEMFFCEKESCQVPLCVGCAQHLSFENKPVFTKAIKDKNIDVEEGVAILCGWCYDTLIWDTLGAMRPAEKAMAVIELIKDKAVSDDLLLTIFDSEVGKPYAKYPGHKIMEENGRPGWEKQENLWIEYNNPIMKGLPFSP